MTTSARRERLHELNRLHADWVRGHLSETVGSFDPAGRPEGSDYNQHHVDLDADGHALDAFDAAARAILAGTSQPSARDGKPRNHKPGGIDHDQSRHGGLDVSIADDSDDDVAVVHEEFPILAARKVKTDWGTTHHVTAVVDADGFLGEPGGRYVAVSDSAFDVEEKDSFFVRVDRLDEFADVFEEFARRSQVKSPPDDEEIGGVRVGVSVAAGVEMAAYHDWAGDFDRNNTFMAESPWMLEIGMLAKRFEASEVAQIVEAMREVAHSAPKALLEPLFFAHTLQSRQRNRAGIPSGSPIEAALNTLRTLASRLPDDLADELDDIIEELASLSKVKAHGNHNQRDHGRRRTGALGSVLDKLESLRDKLGDDDRSVLDAAMATLRGLESSDVDDDDLLDDEDDDDGAELAVGGYWPVDAQQYSDFTLHLDEDGDVSFDYGSDSFAVSLPEAVALRDMLRRAESNADRDSEYRDSTPEFELVVKAANSGEVDELIGRQGTTFEGTELLLEPPYDGNPADVTSLRSALDDIIGLAERAGMIGAPDGGDSTRISALLAAPVLAGDDRALRRYWTRGEGAAEIRWGTEGDFDRCVKAVRKYSDGGTEFDPEGYCAELHHAATGQWPGKGRSHNAADVVVGHLPDRHDQRSHRRKKPESAPAVRQPGEQSTVDVSPEVAEARRKLERAELMHGTDRTKWTKRDRRAAERLDEIIRRAGSVRDAYEPDGADTGRMGIRAAGLAVVAADTGRVLMLQRALDEDDPATGTWEFPGGTLDDGEDPLAAAKREWSEETGCELPPGQLVGEWHSGVYCGYLWRVGEESAVPLHDGRDEVTNPDDPDGDAIETLAWWDQDQLTSGNPALRFELRQSMSAVLTALDDLRRGGLAIREPKAKFDPNQARDDEGKWSDGIGDKLKVGQRIELGPYERLVASRRLPNDRRAGWDLLAAVIDGPEGRQVRLGVIAPGSSKRWAAGPDPKRARRLDELDTEIDRLESEDAEDPGLDPLYDERSELRDDADGLNRTAVFTPGQIQQLRNDVEAGTAKAREWSAAWNKFWEENEPLDAERADLISPRRRQPLTTAEQARLTEIQRQLDVIGDPDPTLAEGVISGADGHDLVWSIEGNDDGQGGWELRLGVRPPEADRDWLPGWDDDRSVVASKQMTVFLKGLSELALPASGDVSVSNLDRAATSRRPPHAHSPGGHEHNQKDHAGGSGWDGLKGIGLMDADEYAAEYGDAVDDRGIDLGDGDKLTARFFQDGTAHVVIDFEDGRSQVLSDIDGGDGMRRLADDLEDAVNIVDEQDVEDEQWEEIVWDTEAGSEHEFRVGRYGSGDVRLEPLGSGDGEYLDLGEEGIEDLISALRDVADSYDVEFDTGVVIETVGNLSTAQVSGRVTKPEEGESQMEAVETARVLNHPGGPGHTRQSHGRRKQTAAPDERFAGETWGDTGRPRRKPHGVPQEPDEPEERWAGEGRDEEDDGPEVTRRRRRIRPRRDDGESGPFAPGERWAGERPEPEPEPEQSKRRMPRIPRTRQKPVAPEESAWRRRRSSASVADVQPWFRISNNLADGGATVHIYNEIGALGLSADQFTKELSNLDVQSIELRLNSPGGDVFEGIAIHNALRQHPAQVHVHVDGVAASIASVIAMAGDRVTMARGSQMMIHEGHTVAVGNCADMTKTAALLDKCSNTIAQFYADRAGGTVEQWRDRMRAETWYSAEEAVQAGLADTVEAPPRGVRGAWNLSVFNYAGRRHAPPPDLSNASPPPGDDTWTTLMGPLLTASTTDAVLAALITEGK